MGKQNFYTSPLFSVAISKSAKETNLLMQVDKSVVYTQELPNTFRFLKKHYPGVLSTECFNDEGLPFKKEVKNTELGHLFEHIVLEEICHLKILNGEKKAEHSGLTSWNWIAEQEGTFHITLDVGAKDFNFLSKALSKAVELLEDLFSAHKLNGQPSQLPAKPI